MKFYRIGQQSALTDEEKALNASLEILWKHTPASIKRKEATRKEFEKVLGEYQEEIEPQAVPPPSSKE